MLADTATLSFVSPWLRNEPSGNFHFTVYSSLSRSVTVKLTSTERPSTISALCPIVKMRSLSGTGLTAEEGVGFFSVGGPLKQKSASM